MNNQKLNYICAAVLFGLMLNLDTPLVYAKGETVRLKEVEVRVNPELKMITKSIFQKFPTHFWIPNKTYLMPSIPKYRTSGAKTPPKIIIKTELPEVPSHFPVYKIEPANLKDHAMPQLAKVLGLRTDQSHNDGKKAVVVEQENDLAVNKSLTVFMASGGMNYMYDGLIYKAPLERPMIPDKKTAYRHALEYLKKRNLLPSDADIHFNKVTFTETVLRERDAKKKETLQRIVTGIEVRFPQVWNGIRVSGPGSKLYVAFGDKGQVVGMTRMWRSNGMVMEKLRSVSPKKALAALQNGIGTYTASSQCDQAQITQVEPVYWSRSPRLPQKVAVPVYEIKGTCFSANGELMGDFAAIAPSVYQGRVTVDPPEPMVDGEPEKRRS